MKAMRISMIILFFIFLAGLAVYNYNASRVFLKAVELGSSGRYRLSGFAHEAVIIGFPASIFSTISRCVMAADTVHGYYAERNSLSLKRYPVLSRVPVARHWKPGAVDLFAPLCIAAFAFFSIIRALCSPGRVSGLAKSDALICVIGGSFVAWAALASDGSLAGLGAASVKASVGFQFSAASTAVWSLFGMVMLYLCWLGVKGIRGPEVIELTELQDAGEPESSAPAWVNKKDAIIADRPAGGDAAGPYRHPCNAGRKEA